METLGCLGGVAVLTPQCLSSALLQTAYPGEGFVRNT